MKNEDILAFFFRVLLHSIFVMGKTLADSRKEINTISYLLGELGLETLRLIAQGCVNDDELQRVSAFKQLCLDVKIPLLETVGLIKVKDDEYFITEYGNDVLLKLTGWKT